MSAKSFIPDRLRSAVCAAQARGWTYDRTARNHPRLSPPRGQIDPRTGRPQGPVTFASSPSDKRGDKNGFAALKRCGIHW